MFIRGDMILTNEINCSVHGRIELELECKYLIQNQSKLSDKLSFTADLETFFFVLSLFKINT